MKFSIQREALLKPLQHVIGAVERRQTMPTLANVLLRGEEDRLSLTTTDLEIELHARLEQAVEMPGETTLPARKLLDICNSLPEGATLEFTIEDQRGVLKAGRSRFSLAALPAEDFPELEAKPGSSSFVLPQGQLKTVLECTAFSMASQDVRYYLNGLLLDLTETGLKAVATDGHRLAKYELETEQKNEITARQVVVPRKGVQELQRLLASSDEEVELQCGENHLRVELPGLRLTSKLIDGRFPDYERVIPKDGDKLLSLESKSFRQALARTAILSNEKYRGIRLVLGAGELKLQAHNPEQEEAEERLEVDYQGEPLEIGFNVNYLLDVLATVEGEQVELVLKDSNSSALIRDPQAPQALYVIMPMRL